MFKRQIYSYPPLLKTPISNLFQFQTQDVEREGRGEGEALQQQGDRQERRVHH